MDITVLVFWGLNESGWGADLSAHANYGLQGKGVDGSFVFRFDPAYGYVIDDNIMLSASLRGLMYPYTKMNDKGGEDTAVNGGITLTPMIHLKP